jgi:hypothetical protein
MLATLFQYFSKNNQFTPCMMMFLWKKMNGYLKCSIETENEMGANCIKQTK